MAWHGMAWQSESARCRIRHLEEGRGQASYPPQYSYAAPLLASRLVSVSISILLSVFVFLLVGPLFFQLLSPLILAVASSAGVVQCGCRAEERREVCETRDDKKRREGRRCQECNQHSALQCMLPPHCTSRRRMAVSASGGPPSPCSEPAAALPCNGCNRDGARE